MTRKALYNSLRMSWLQDSTLSLKEWQVEDLRTLSLGELFTRLASYNIRLDRLAFVTYADQFETPEELAESIVGEDIDSEAYDHIYLLVFELWRRLVPEKLSLSLLCDELDYQIFLYDTGALERLEPLQDALEKITVILEENKESGLSPEELFEAVNEECANDIALFLYDYSSMLLDEAEYEYAKDLIEKFYFYIQDKKWFDFLRVQIVFREDIELAHTLLQECIERNKEHPDMQLSLDILHFMIENGEYTLFVKTAKQLFPLIKEEEDICEFFGLFCEFFSLTGQEEKCARWSTLLDSPQELFHEFEKLKVEEITRD